MADADHFPFRWACKRLGNCCAIPGGFVRVTASEVVWPELLRYPELLALAQRTGPGIERANTERS